MAGEIIINPLNTQRIEITLIGDTSLIMHKWSEKARRQLLEAQMTEVKSRKKDLRDPIADFVNTIYFLDREPAEPTMEALNEYLQNGGRIGFPATAFKACAISGAYQTGADIKKTTARANIHIPDEFIVIEGEIVKREDMVRLGGINRVADIRFRAEIRNWTAVVPVEFNSDLFSAQMVVNMFEQGGFAVGVGEWRPEKGGNFGRFHVQRG